MPASSTLAADGAAASPIRHPRPRGAGGVQPTVTVELFFDLAYVFAVTQLSHQILDDRSATTARFCSARSSPRC